MKRIVAAFENGDDAGEARQALREEDLESREPSIDNPFFDPSTKMPEGRGLLWGGLIGGLIGAILLFAWNEHIFSIPRLSPIMTAGRYELIVLGFGLGAAIGGFVGGVIGVVRRTPELDKPRVAVTVPDHRTGEVESLLRSHGATTVEGAVTHHEHPQQSKVTESSTSSD
ncbi:hypothetical protein [Natrinema sp. 1APR25-10V2]|uniref:hypothetical protein n=1 Tax=Natrinema sp. 1APR25-10V2 TaxID=2951081 RepID=UPI002874A5DE|nr:hypothetical protein [Natrinema sp. 1APR25-10V2]MDS0478112.1 hypothetical protein [Natrinema sp. 1APR25-10V2]